MLRWPNIRVSRVHRATVVRTDRHMLAATKRHVALYELDAGGSWVRMPFREATQPDKRLPAIDWVSGLVQTALVCAAIYVVAAFILAVGPDRW